MSELEDLRDRVAQLEATVREQGEMLARVRAAADRDQADIGSTVSATHHLVQGSWIRSWTV